MPSRLKAHVIAVDQLSSIHDAKTLAKVLKALPHENAGVMNQLVDQFDGMTRVRQPQQDWLACFLRHAPIVWRGEMGSKIVSRTMIYALHHRSTTLLDALLERGRSDAFARPLFELHFMTHLLEHLNHHPQWGQKVLHWFLVHPLMNQEQSIRPNAMLLDRITPRPHPSSNLPQVEACWEIIKQTVRPEEVCHVLLCGSWQEKSNPSQNIQTTDIKNMWVNLSLEQSLAWTEALAKAWDKTAPSNQKAIDEFVPHWRPQWEKKLLEGKIHPTSKSKKSFKRKI